jgi:hypothetical protein
MTILRVSPEDKGTLGLGSVPNSAEFKRYAEVARRLAKQQQGSDGLIWVRLAVLWDDVADRMANKEARSPSAQHQHHIEEWETGD